MNIRIERVLTLIITSLLILSAVHANDLPEVQEGFNINQYNVQIYYDSHPDSHEMEILNLPSSAWFPLPGNSLIPANKNIAWLKISLPEGSIGQDLYLTEHAGMARWEVFFFSENLLLDREIIDWNSYHIDRLQAQYRGFSSFQVFNSNHKDVVLLIKMTPDVSGVYNFYLRGRQNFQQNFNTWIFVQGIGVGLIIVVLMLTLIMSIRLRYKIDWLYLVLVLFAGLNISYITGLGPKVTARFLPMLGPTVWVMILGIFNVFSVYYIEEFAQLKESRKFSRYYFLLIKVLAIAVIVLLPFLPQYRLFLVMNITTFIFLLLIMIGLIRLTVQKVPQAGWILSGWILLIVITFSGYITKHILPDSQSLSVISYIFGQAILLIFLGTALIKQMDERLMKESDRRQSAEHIAESVVKRMSDHKRMADLGSMVSSVTHELGTPLGVAVTLSSNISNTGQNITQLFKEGSLSEDEFTHFLKDVLESSELIEKNMENARTLMEGFKQVAADQAAPDIRTLNLKSYVAQVVRILMTQIKKTPYKLVQNIPEDIFLTTTPGIMTQVLTNLVNNAIIHGFSNREEGRIIISAEKEPGRNFLNIKVEDNGNGIPRDIQNKIFNMYFTTRKGLGGTGIGLPIVKSLVEERLSGSITMESQEGSGTVFTIVLPMNPKDHQ